MLTQPSYTRASATGCATVYNDVLSRTGCHRPFPPDWSFDRVLRVEHVWDAFTLYCLQEHHRQRGEPLMLPHGGVQHDRFRAAVEARNAYVQVHGLPDLAHYCTKCVRFWTDDEGIPTCSYQPAISYTHCPLTLHLVLLAKTSCVVIDGVTIGHPCCSVHNCHEGLLSQRDRFCASHSHLLGVCSVIDCARPVVNGRRVCADPIHQSIEDLYALRGQSRFQLAERLERARMANTAATAAAGLTLSTDFEDSAEVMPEEDFVLNEKGKAVVCRLSSNFPIVFDVIVSLVHNPS